MHVLCSDLSHLGAVLLLSFSHLMFSGRHMLFSQGDTARVEDGITIEPFNLNQEREEGYFDAEGNYVEYRLNDDDKVVSSHSS